MKRDQETQGCILWLTGLSGSGKSTLAAAVADRIGRVSSVEVLDGDAMRTHLSPGLGFSRTDRELNIRRIAFVARLLARHGVFVIVAAISPYASSRREARESSTREGIPFLEVFLDPAIESLIARDVKGLYKAAIAGNILHFTGISDPYERPQEPDLQLATDKESVEASTSTIVALAFHRGIISTLPIDPARG